MESLVLPTIVGSVISGVTSVVFSVFGRHASNHKLMLSRNNVNRQRLYSAFIKEVSSVYIKSLDGSTTKPSTLVRVYSLVAQMRLMSSEKVLQAAEMVVAEIMDSFDQPTITIEDMRKMAKENRPRPIREFIEACREERLSNYL